jgi:hypothetical protein
LQATDAVVVGAERAGESFGHALQVQPALPFDAQDLFDVRPVFHCVRSCTGGDETLWRSRADMDPALPGRFRAEPLNLPLLLVALERLEAGERALRALGLSHDGIAP